MAREQLVEIIDFRGGYATDLSPQVRGNPGHMVKAEGVVFERSGARAKVGGSSRLNSVALTGGVTGMFDFWLSGVSGTSIQRFVVMTDDSKIHAEPGNGTFVDITGSATVTANAVPVFSEAYDLLCIFTDRNDTPLKWNQVGNVATLGGSPPIARGMVFHANRGWAWGVNATPSRLFYGDSTDIEIWSGIDAGFIDIDPEDGDRILFCVSHKQRLLVFKGPYKGSVHEISGLVVDDFARQVLVRGIPAQSPQGHVTVGDDIWYLSHRGVHSISATERFGNFADIDLTRDLRGFFADRITRTSLHLSHAVNYETVSTVLLTFAAAGAATPNTVLALFYGDFATQGIEGIKASVWTVRNCQSAGIRISPATLKREVIFGTTDGRIELQDTSPKTMADGTAVNYEMTTPAIILGTQDRRGAPKGDIPVVLRGLYVRYLAQGTSNLTVTVTRDNLVISTITIDQTPQAGFILGTSKLGTGKLGGGGGGGEQLQVGTGKLTGRTRSVILGIQQNTTAGDAEIYEVGIKYLPVTESERTVID